MWTVREQRRRALLIFAFLFFRESVLAIAIAVEPSSSSSKCLFDTARMKLKRVVRVCYLIGESISRHRIEYKMREQEYVRQLTMTTATTTKRMRPIRLALRSTKRWHFFAFAVDQIVICIFSFAFTFWFQIRYSRSSASFATFDAVDLVVVVVVVAVVVLSPFSSFIQQNEN